MWCFFPEFRALFMGPINTKKRKFYFKIGSHGTIRTFKNYFVTIFSAISSIQIDSYLSCLTHIFVQHTSLLYKATIVYIIT